MRILLYLRTLMLAGLLLPGCAEAQEPFHNVTPAEAAVLLKDPAVFLLDVRTPPENATARIAGDTLAPVQTLEHKLDLLPTDKNRPVLIYCRSGNRSVTAARILAKHGHTTIYNMTGGMIGWQKAGRPVESGPRESAAPVIK
jgi:phage shock protein E